MYIRERPNDASSEHFHLLLHCPDELEDELNKATPRWAEAHDDRAVRIRRCWERKVIRGQEYNARSLALGYMLKAGDVNVKKRFPRSNRWSDEQGTIVGKRVGVSAAIGPKALASFRKNPVFGVISGPQQPQEISNSIKGGIQISQQISIQKNAAA
jgi:hypothetical protein